MNQLVANAGLYDVGISKGRNVAQVVLLPSAATVQPALPDQYIADSETPYSAYRCESCTITSGPPHHKNESAKDQHHIHPTKNAPSTLTLSATSNHSSILLTYGSSAASATTSCPQTTNSSKSAVTRIVPTGSLSSLSSSIPSGRAVSSRRSMTTPWHCSGSLMALPWSFRPRKYAVLLPSENTFVRSCCFLGERD